MDTDSPTGEYNLDELEFLCKTLDISTHEKIIQKREKTDPKYYVGEGKLEEITAKCIESVANYIIFDDELTPSQLRNLEKRLTRRIVDRSELILEIFEQRARTRSAKLQIELARMKYMLPRLKRMWTHLSRIEGGISTGGGGGPGEKQIELDRRAIRDRIHMLSKKIDKIANRKKVSIEKRSEEFQVSLVGYTNVGKTTLLNRLAGTKLFAENKLFATLDTTTRKVRINSHKKMLISDTIGFIRKIPHDLIAPFYSTLEELKNADLLLHVADITHPENEVQIETVEKELKNLGLEEKPSILVLNKIDMLKDNKPNLYSTKDYYAELHLSAKEGIGIEELTEKIESFMIKDYVLCNVKVDASEGKLLSLLKANSDVLHTSIEKTMIHMSLFMDQKFYGRLKKNYPDLITT